MKTAETYRSASINNQYMRDTRLDSSVYSTKWETLWNRAVPRESKQEVSQSIQLYARLFKTSYTQIVKMGIPQTV